MNPGGIASCEVLAFKQHHQSRNSMVLEVSVYRLVFLLSIPTSHLLATRSLEVSMCNEKSPQRTNPPSMKQNGISRSEYPATRA